MVVNPLLPRIARGEQSAVAECLSRYGGMVWSLARRFLGDATEAEDAVQDIFVELWKNADRYNSALSSEATFITMVARRRLIDRRRKLGRRAEHVTLPESVPEPQSGSVSTRMEIADEAAKAIAALSELRPEQQEVLKLAVYHGMTHEQIALSTGLPLGTVKTHARRGLMRLRELLGMHRAGMLSPLPNPALAGGL
ncbi:MAG: sigma-70 family RNA polymerase sigma factor [Planctomycetia bacterium]|nr:sigma-70 family RNA polymerase sigma factor [Planctomycetia bacterium]